MQNSAASIGPNVDQGMQIASFASLLNEKTVVLADSGDFAAVEMHFLRAVLQPFIQTVKVDEKWYLAAYQDIAKAVAKRTVKGARDHYQRFGFFEHRLPYRIMVDEGWYLEAYPDVKEAVARKAFASGQAHFESSGFREGRIPFPDFSLERA